MKTLIALATVCLSLFQATGYGEDVPVFTQRMGSGMLLVRTIQTNWSFRSVCIPVSEMARFRTNAATRPVTIPVSVEIQSAFVLQYSNSVSGLQPPIWMYLNGTAKEERGYEGKLSKADKGEIPYMFHSAFYDPTTRVCAIHLRQGRGENTVWFGDPNTWGDKGPLFSQGSTREVPDARVAKTSEFRLIPSEKLPVLDIEYENGERKRFRLGPERSELVEVVAKE